MVLGRLIGLAAALSVAAAAAFAQDRDPGEWPHYAADLSSTRYSPLDQIHAGNVDQLEIVWRWTSRNFGPRPDFNLRTTPLMLDGVVYVTAGARRAAIAMDAATGETLWTYRLDEGKRGESAPRQTSGRGVSFWSDGETARVFLVTPAYRLVALDADTGRLIPGFGLDGMVDLRRNLGREVDLETAAIGSGSPPTVVGDVIVVGAALVSGSAPPSPENAPSPVRGYDARSGELLWTFHTIPREGEFGNDTWENDSWRTTGNTGVWAWMSADPELGLVYLPTEAPTGDYYGGHRPGDNLFSQSVVALDVATGERRWHYQTVHHPIWDYDLPTAPVLLDLTVDGREIPALAQVTKQAFTFVLDRRTGEPVWPIEERPMPASTVPGEKTAPTQPFPTKPPPFQRQGVSEDDLIDLTPELKEQALQIARFYTLGPLFTPPTVMVPRGNRGTLTVPGALGGANWPSVAADPETGIVYVSSGLDVNVLGLENDPERSTMDFVQGTRREIRLPEGGGPQGLPLLKPPWGLITALDLNRGEILWQVPNSDTPEWIREHPALEGVELGRTGQSDRGGLLVTKTLLFAGEGSGMFAAFGTGGPMFRAHDKATGEILWEFELPANQSGTPMSYEVDGRQFIVVAVGAPDHAAEFVALALPEAE